MKRHVACLGVRSDLVGKEVVNGVGVPLGTVARLVRDASGDVVALVVRERGVAKEWTVERENILAVRDRVLLKGPRQGYHIMPLASLPQRS